MIRKKVKQNKHSIPFLRITLMYCQLLQYSIMYTV